MPLRLPKIFRNLRRRNDGTAAVEMALVALPFFLIIAAMLETGYVSFKAAIMEGAAREAARQVRTGIVQNAADAAGRFQQEFCPNLMGMFPCANFYFDVRSFPDYAAVALPDPVYNAQGVPQNLSFAPGGADSIVSVRVFHTHSFATPLVGNLMGGSGGTLPLISTMVFRTEPFE